jgi:hypothetical protein
MTDIDPRGTKKKNWTLATGTGTTVPMVATESILCPLLVLIKAATTARIARIVADLVLLVVSQNFPPSPIFRFGGTSFKISFIRDGQENCSGKFYVNYSWME